MDRGSAGAYAAYFAGMDTSMQQKVALTAAYFPPSGRIADMGSGSGRGTHDLACLYTGLELVGVDIDPKAVEFARANHRRQNLSFILGDIGAAVFPSRSLDGILDSSVLHHVSSFNGFSLEHVLVALDRHVDALKENGVIVIRDFVAPRGPARVLLDLRADDGAAAGSIEALSTAALFERFARDFRSSQNREAGVSFVERDAPRAGIRRLEVSLRAAAEFVLRKDYRKSWEAELHEEYFYLDQSGFERELARRGLRVVTSMEIHNPWIIQHRFQGKLELFDLEARPLPFPPTNYLIVGERVPQDRGVRLEEVSSQSIGAPSFVRLERFASARGFKEVVHRPNPTIDLVPWFLREDQVFVLVRRGFPRPILRASAYDEPNLTGARSAGYFTEPISAFRDPRRSTRDNVERILFERAEVEAGSVRDVGEVLEYFPSPGGIAEKVEAHLVEIDPHEINREVAHNYTAFSSAGKIAHLDAAQVLRACQVDGMFDNRLELNVYELYARLGRWLGPWIGAEIPLSEQVLPSSIAVSARAVLSPPARAIYTREASAAEAEFLDVRSGRFRETSALGVALFEADFEYVVPKRFSHNTIVALPVIAARDAIHVGLEHRDLAGVQVLTGSSAIATVPAWRLPKAVLTLDAAHAFARARMHSDFGARLLSCWPLGGRYHPSPGVTPEVVHPTVVEIDAGSAALSALSWVRLEDLLAEKPAIRDAHLRTAALRLHHALSRAAPPESSPHRR